MNPLIIAAVASSPPLTTTFIVSPTQTTWQDTGIDVPLGGAFTVSRTGEYVYLGSSFTPAAGTPYGSPHHLLGALAVALIAPGVTPLLDGTGFPSGGQYPQIPTSAQPVSVSFVASLAGRLWLADNDYIGCYSDNSGRFVVTIILPLVAETLAGSGFCTGNPSLTWNAQYAVNSYRLEKRTGGTGAFVPVYSGTTTAFTDVGNTLGIGLEYRVFAVSAGVDSPVSNIVTGTPNLAPPTPTGVNATPFIDVTCAASITVTWGASARATSYTVTRGDGAAQILTGTSATFAALIARLDTFTVTATNSCGTSAASLSAAASPTGTGLPAPTVTACQPCCKPRASLTWTAVTGAAGYEIRRGGVLIVTVGMYVLSFIDTGLSPSTNYTYSVTPTGGCYAPGAGTVTIRITGWGPDGTPSNAWAGETCGCG